MTDSPKIVYLTFDGLLEPLGESQVVRVVERLARKGYRYSIVSLERAQHVSDRHRVDAMMRRLSAAGIGWTFAPYAAGAVGKWTTNFARAGWLVREQVLDGARLVHARGYHAALVARALGSAIGVPYLFDARGRWVDERILQGRWFTNPLSLKAARRVETDLYERARAVVTLTVPHAKDVTSGQLARVKQPVRVIPTCADYDLFESAAQLRDADRPLTLLISGSHKPMCHHSEAMQLARRVMERKTDARLLIISSEHAALLELAERNGLPSERIVASGAAPEEMPGWLAQVDWAIHFVSTAECNRGMFPTKLAEFFASGVRPLHFGCNEDVASWVERAATGLVIQSLERAELDRAADYIIESGVGTPELLSRGRQQTRSYLHLDSGVDRYEELLKEILRGGFAAKFV